MRLYALSWEKICGQNWIGGVKRYELQFKLCCEFAVAKSLGELSEGRTTLTIAHRLSSIRNSDRILVLTDDGIVEEGDHDQLMEQKGIYYQFYETANALK